jgi:hypothetical protein
MATTNDPRAQRIQECSRQLAVAVADYSAALDAAGDDLAHTSIGLRSPQMLEMFASRLREILGDDVDDEAGWHGGGWSDHEGV